MSTAPVADGRDRGKAFVQVLSCVLSRLVVANDAVRLSLVTWAGMDAAATFNIANPPLDL